MLILSGNHIIIGSIGGSCRLIDEMAVFIEHLEGLFYNPLATVTNITIPEEI